MKKKYYVSKIPQTNGGHEVHMEGCSYLPRPENMLYVEEHEVCQSAVREARRYYPQANGCYYCCPACHTS